MDYLEADDLFFAIVESGGADMFASTRATSFPETYRAMFGFCAKANSLKTAIFDMVDSGNPYAFKALFRCYCEHYLKFTYLFTRFLKEKSDAVGNEYYSFCGAVELRDYAKAIVMAEGLVGHTIVGNIEKAIAQLYPDAGKLNDSDLEAASAKFRYRAILRFLSKDTPGMISKETPFLSAIVPTYALLSSFVHGGPWTDREMYTYDKPEALQECRRDAGVVFMMTAGVFLLTALAVSREFPQYGVLVSQTKAVMDRFLAESSVDA